MTDKELLMRIVERAFRGALALPIPEQWKNCSVLAGCAAARMAADGDMYMAAQFDGVANEAKRRLLASVPEAAA